MAIQTCKIRSDFHVRLQHETRPFHSRLESRLRLLDPHLTVDEYRALLRLFYGFYKPLEYWTQAMILPSDREVPVHVGA